MSSDGNLSSQHQCVVLVDHDAQDSYLPMYMYKMKPEKDCDYDISQCKKYILH